MTLLFSFLCVCCFAVGRTNLKVVDGSQVVYAGHPAEFQGEEELLVVLAGVPEVLPHLQGGIASGADVCANVNMMRAQGLTYLCVRNKCSIIIINPVVKVLIYIVYVLYYNKDAFVRKLEYCSHWKKIDWTPQIASVIDFFIRTGTPGPNSGYCKLGLFLINRRRTK